MRDRTTLVTRNCCAGAACIPNSRGCNLPR